MIVAKTVIPNQYWILREDDRKVGNIEADPLGGYQVKINNHTERFRTIHTIKRQVNINFEPARMVKESMDENTVHGYPTTHSPFNGIYDVKHQVPLWTKEERSKSWYAAGWYRIKQGRNWVVAQCPKLITIQRYQYQGPFHTRQEAEQS